VTRHRVRNTVAGSVATRVAPGMPHTARNSVGNGRGQRVGGQVQEPGQRGERPPRLRPTVTSAPCAPATDRRPVSLSPLPRMRTVSEHRNGSTRVASGVDAWPSRRAIVGPHRASVKARHSAPPACAASALTDAWRSPDRQLRDGHGVVHGQDHCRITSRITTRTNASTKQCEDDGMNDERNQNHEDGEVLDEAAR
jgi:hypothetical protein